MDLTSVARSAVVAVLVLSTPFWASEKTAGESRFTTNYWYGGELHPLVVERDGVNYLLIGKEIVEMAGASGPARTYAHADHLGSTRVITDDQGKVVQSLANATIRTIPSSPLKRSSAGGIPSRIRMRSNLWK